MLREHRFHPWGGGAGGAGARGLAKRIQFATGYAPALASPACSGAPPTKVYLWWGSGGLGHAWALVPVSYRLHAPALLGRSAKQLKRSRLRFCPHIIYSDLRRSATEAQLGLADEFEFEFDLKFDDRVRIRVSRSSTSLSSSSTSSSTIEFEFEFPVRVSG